MMRSNIVLGSTLVIALSLLFLVLAPTQNPAGPKPAALSDLKRVLTWELEVTIARRALTGGCMARALQDAKLAPLAIKTDGGACVTHLAPLLEKNFLGLPGPCSGKTLVEAEKCFFVLGYVDVLVFTSQSPDTEEELKGLQSTVNSAFETYKRNNE
jgi:hypothetical protein